MSEVVDPSNMVMLHHPSWELNEGAWGEVGRYLLGLSHNVHTHYLVIKRDDMPRWLVMFTHLADLCFLPLQITGLTCRYFKLPVN